MLDPASTAVLGPSTSNDHLPGLVLASKAVFGFGPARRQGPDHGEDEASLQQGEEVVADCTDAMRFSPVNAQLNLERGNARSSLRIYRQALADYDQAIALDSDNGVDYLARYQAKSDLGVSRPSPRGLRTCRQARPDLAEAPGAGERQADGPLANDPTGVAERRPDGTALGARAGPMADESVSPVSAHTRASARTPAPAPTSAAGPARSRSSLAHPMRPGSRAGRPLIASYDALLR